MNGPVYRFKLTGETNASYTVQTTTSLPAPGPWQPLLDLTLTNDTRSVKRRFQTAAADLTRLGFRGCLSRLTWVGAGS